MQSLGKYIEIEKADTSPELIYSIMLSMWLLLFFVCIIRLEFFFFSLKCRHVFFYTTRDLTAGNNISSPGGNMGQILFFSTSMQKQDERRPGIV